MNKMTSSMMMNMMSMMSMQMLVPEGRIHN